MRGDAQLEDAAEAMVSATVSILICRLRVAKALSALFPTSQTRGADQSSDPAGIPLSRSSDPGDFTDPLGVQSIE
jgi:hypothetical protein